MTGLPLSRSAASPRTSEHATPYGAAELRLVANRTLLRGFAVATTLAVTAIGGGRWITDALAASTLPNEPPVIQVGPAPRVKAPEPRTSAAVHSGRTSPTLEVRAIPIPVPESEAPPEEVTLAPTGGDVALPGPESEGVAGGLPEGTGLVPMVPAEPEPVESPTREETPVEPAVRPVERAPEVFHIVEVMPTVATRTMPVYPELARQAGLEGRVTVRVRVGRDGRVKEASVLRSDNGAFDDSALTAARQWTFTPGIQAGQPVEVWMTIPIRFRQTAR